MRFAYCVWVSMFILVAGFGCQSDFRQAEYRTSGSYLILDGIGFRGVALAMADNFRYVSDLSQISAADPRREFFTAQSAALNASEGLDYHFYKPVAFLGDSPDMGILVTPGLMKRMGVTFASVPQDRREQFVRSFALQGRLWKITDDGYRLYPTSTAAGRTYAIISNDSTDEGFAYEERVVIGNSNEFLLVLGLSSLANRSRLSERLEELIESLDFHPDKLPVRAPDE